MKKLLALTFFAIIGVSSNANAALIGLDNSLATKDELCQFKAVNEASFIDLNGTTKGENFNKVLIGETESWLRGHDTRIFTNIHNGEEIIEKEICGVPDNVIVSDVPRVRGILLTTPEYYRQKINSNFKTPGFFLRDLPILTQDPYINDRLYSYEGEEISPELLDSVIRDVIVFMRDKNQPVVDVYFPEQDVTDGFIVGLVSRAVVDKVVVHGNEYYTEEDIKKFVNVKPNDYIWSDILSQDLRWINSYPYRSVDVIMKPGSRPRTTDVIFETKDMYPFRVFGGVDNYGAPAIDENQYYLGFSYGNLFGLDHEIIYSFGSAFDTAQFSSHNLQYIIPFEWRHKLSLSGSISEAESNAQPFTFEGSNVIVNVDYEMPLYDFGFRGFTQSVNLGVDYKRLENDIEFGGLNIFNSEPEIVQFYAKYEASRTSNKTTNEFTVTGIVSPGDITSNNTEEDFELARAGADPDYAYVRSSYDASYTSELANMIFRGLFRGQYTPERLLTSEQINIGGPGAVRGFAANTIRRDSGFIATLEVASPYVPVIDNFLGTTLRDRVQGFVFYDKGYGENVETVGNNSTVDLDSYGVGTRFGIGRNLSGVIEYGREIDDEFNDGTDEHLHFRLNTAY